MKKMFVLAALLSGLFPGGFATSGPVPSEIRRADANIIPYVEETSTGIVEDFESGTLSDQWTLDPNFGQTSDTDPTHYTGFDREAAVSDRSTIGWVEKLPFNKDGKYFFNGWNDQGGAAAEGASWRLLSQPFTLTGSGLITAKMGGNSCRLSLYSSSEEPLAADAQALVSVDTTPWWTDKMDMTLGGNNVTMRRVYMDASAFVGQEVILALEDYRAGGNWGHAFFDSINTNVDLSEFKFKVDVVEQLADGWGQSKKFAFTDYYQAGESQGDLAYVKEAYEFLVDYYASARSQEDIYTYCELPGDKLSAIVDQYDALSAEAKAIVDRSDDFSYSGYLNHKGEVVYEEDIAINAVGESMINLRAMASGKTSVSGALVVNGGSDSSLLPMVCGLALLLIGGAFVCVYFHLRKKKENK